MRKDPSKWNNKFQSVRKFRAEMGSFPAASAKDREEMSLGSWCSNQRLFKKRGQLLPEQEDSLNSIPGWYWGLDDKWELSRIEWEDFYIRNGRPPSRLSFGAERAERILGDWAQNQRQAQANHPQGRKLKPSRVARLNKTQGWKWSEPDATPRIYEEYKQYVSDHNGQHPMWKHRLSRWASDRRNDYRVGKLAPYWKGRLGAIPGWWWEIPDSRENLNTRILAFVEKHGRLPRHNIPEEVSLAQGCTRRREEYRSGRLSREETRILGELPGWVWGKDIIRADDVIRFCEEHGRLPDSHIKEEVSYANWCATQRDKYKNRGRSRFRCGQISQELITRLEALSCWTWDLHEFKWQENYAELSKYPGGVRALPPGKLSEWCGTQRHFRRKGKLSPARQASLEALDGWEWDYCAVKWQENYDAVLGHPEGMMALCSTDERLRGWCSSQRAAYRKGKLSQEKIEALEEIPNWWWKIEDRNI